MNQTEKVAKWLFENEQERMDGDDWDSIRNRPLWEKVVQRYLAKAKELLALIGQQAEPPEDDWDNEDYMRGWQDAKRDSVDPRSKTPCPGCARGDEPVMLDEDGTRCSVSGEPGRLGHGVDDRFWFCDDHIQPDQQGEPVAWATLNTVDEAMQYTTERPGPLARLPEWPERAADGWCVRPLVYLHPPASREVGDFEPWMVEFLEGNLYALPPSIRTKSARERWREVANARIAAAISRLFEEVGDE